jgi:Ca2+-binding EF-hand superfamily protein
LNIVGRPGLDITAKIRNTLQAEMMTRAELAFSVLDTKKTGYITLRQLKVISKKLSHQEVKV